MKKLRRICCEETDRARQARMDDLSMHQKRVPTTVGQLLTQIQGLQNKVNSLSDAREFDDPETASSSGAPHVPSRPLTIPSPRGMPSRDSGLPHDTRNVMVPSGNVSDSPPAREGPSSAIFENSRNLTGSRPKGQTLSCRTRGAQEVANLEQTLASVGAGNRVRSAGEACKNS